VRSADGVGLQAAQAKVGAPIDRACDIDGLCCRARSGAMVADIEIDQKIHRPLHSRVPFDLPHVIDDRHGAGRNDARDLRGIRKRRREQYPGNPALGHQLSFSDRCD